MNYARESVFTGAIRSLCKTFAGTVGILLGVVLLILILTFSSGPDFMPEKCEIRIAPDSKGETELLSRTSPAILRINFHGIIGEGDLTEEKIENVLSDSRIDFLNNNRVKGIFLHMNTPGGEATNADGIYRALMRYKEKHHVPIYAYIDGLCASGGMYISAAADKIYCSPTSVAGSIGIILGPTFNFSGAMDKIGIQSLTMTRGKDKDMLNPFRPWKEGEDASLQDILANLYEQFVSVMVAGRPKLTKEKLTNEYGAQVYIASKAMELGYVDEGNSNYYKALQDLTITAGIQPDQKYQVVELSVHRSFLADLAQGKSPLFSGKLVHGFNFGPGLSSEMSGKFLYLYQPMPSEKF